MYLESALFPRQTCPGTQLFYRCGSTGFIGCCSVNPCSGGCPDEDTNPTSPSSTTTAALTSSASSSNSLAMTFSVVVPEPSQSSSSVALSLSSVSSSSTTRFFPSSTKSAQPTASPPSTAVTTTQLPSPAASQSGLSRAAIGGLVAGLIVLLQIAILCGFIYWRRRRLRRPKISGPMLLKTGRSVESFNSDGKPFSGLNREPMMKSSMVHRITTHFAGKQDDWARYDSSRRQDSFNSTTSDDVSPVSDDERMEEKEREIGPSPLGSNPVRILEMDATASSRPVEVESPVEPAFQRNAFPPRDPSSLQSSQRSHSRRQSAQRAARSLSPISEGTDSPRATLQATPKERQQKKYVTDWSQFGPAELG